MRPEQLLESLVCSRRIKRRTVEDEPDIEARSNPGGSRQSRVVRPTATGRHNPLRARGERLPDVEFQGTELAATQGKREEIVALDPDVRFRSNRFCKSRN